MKRRLIEFACAHCSADAGEPCVSVGGKRIVTLPHMARLKAAGVYDDSRSVFSEAVQEYEENAIVSIFGVPLDRIPKRIIDRAKKERSIDMRKLWVKDAIAMLGGNRRKAENEQGALL